MVDFAKRCVATNRKGEPCKRSAELGTDVCHWHGGKAPQTLNVAQKRQQEEKLARAAALLGLPIEVDPHTALVEELRRAAGNVAWLQGQVEERGIEGMVEHSDQYGGRPSVWYLMWTQERERLRAVSVECAKVGVEERRVSIVTENARQMSQMIRSILHALDIAIDERVSDIVKTQLMLGASVVHAEEAETLPG